LQAGKKRTGTDRRTRRKCYNSEESQQNGERKGGNFANFYGGTAVYGLQTTGDINTAVERCFALVFSNAFAMITRKKKKRKVGGGG